jgi:hypothetical protein
VMKFKTIFFLQVKNVYKRNGQNVDVKVLSLRYDLLRHIL